MSKKAIRGKPKPTTGIDNVLIHNLQLFNRYVEPIQIELPYKETAISEGAFTMHDWWVIVALLFYVDFDDPSAVHRIESTSEVLTLMQYTKLISDASAEVFGSRKFDTKYFEAFFESIHRLRSTNIRLRYNRQGEPGYGETTILTYFFYVEDDSLLDPRRLTTVDVNKTRAEGQNHVEIHRRADSEGRLLRYKAFEFSFSPYVVEGLKPDKDHKRIGWTQLAQALMELREPLSKNPPMIKIMFWSMRQRSRPIRRKIETIATWAEYKDKPGRRHKKAIQALQRLADLGFAENVVIDEESGIVEFEVAKRWQYAFDDMPIEGEVT